MSSSAVLAPDPHLRGFTRLAPRIFHYVPPPPSSSTSTSSTSAKSSDSSATLATGPEEDDGEDADAPAIILLCTWVGAQPRHIAKYSSAYIARFPHVPLLVVTTSLADFALRTEGWKSASLVPAVEVLLSTLSDENGNGNITEEEKDNTRRRRRREVHLQLLSNGGSDTANRIAALYKERKAGLLPLRRMVLDSAPGSPDYWTSFSAITLSIPAPGWVRRTLLAPVVHAYLALVSLFFALRLLRNPVRLLRGALLDKGRWERLDGAERVYVYSKADKLVGWRDVESHADEAEARGWQVRRERFEGSAHVGHLREDEGRYWMAVLGRYHKG